jgi:uncharacterized protein
MNPNAVKQCFPQLVERLTRNHPEKIILFGSYAYGTPTEHSDIDLLVVLNRDSVPQNYREKTQLYLEVAKQIRDFRKQISIDLIVYTRPMYQQFIEQESQFSKEILQKGVLLYEANHSRMA